MISSQGSKENAYILVTKSQLKDLFRMLSKGLFFIPRSTKRLKLFSHYFIMDMHSGTIRKTGHIATGI